MKKVSFIFIFFIFLVATSVMASNLEKRRKAEFLVDTTRDYYIAHGLEKTVEEIGREDSSLKDGEFYVFLINYKTGIVTGHGASRAIIGRDFLKVKDADGKFFLQAIIDASNGNDGGWAEYKWPNPVTKKIENKFTYAIKLDDTYLIGSGYYEKEEE